MALCRTRKKRNWSKLSSEEFDYINLLEHLQELKEYGFFYTKEWFCMDESGGNCNLWKYDKAWLERVIPKEWLQKYLEEISMEFVHFLTGEKKYLHMVWEPYGYRKGGRAKLFLNGRQFIGNENFMVENKRASCFERILNDCDIYPNSREFREISEYAIRCRDESYFSALYKNRYRQTKVSRPDYMGRESDCKYWAGEFVQEQESTDTNRGETEYLYLVQLKKSEPVHSNGSYARYYNAAKLFMLKTKECREVIRIGDGIEIRLRDMKWQHRPFPYYFDLPKEEHIVEKFLIDKSKNKPDEVVEDFLQKLKEMGYRYRREQVWVAGNKEKENGEVIKEMPGFDAEYLARGVSKILMEFVNSTEGERAYIEIEPQEQTCYISNGIGEGNYELLQTTYFREDRSSIALFYGEEKTSEYEEEIIIPEPVCLELLKKYELITEEQIYLCYLSAQREFQDWFEQKYFVLNMGDAVEADPEFRQEQMERLAKARRIVRRLKYQLIETCEIGNKTMEIYANEYRDRAIYLIDNGYLGIIKLVDKYMNVNESLPVK